MCQHCLLKGLWGSLLPCWGVAGILSQEGNTWLGSLSRTGVPGWDLSPGWGYLGSPLRAGWLQMSTVGTGAAQREEGVDALQCDP